MLMRRVPRDVAQNLQSQALKTSFPATSRAASLRPFSVIPIHSNPPRRTSNAIQTRGLISASKSQGAEYDEQYHDEVAERAEKIGLRLVQTADRETMKVLEWGCEYPGIVRQISFNSPRNKNSISRKFLAELSEQIEDLHSQDATSPTRALVLSSELPDVFCAGADLKERATMSTSEVEAFLKSMRNTFARLESLPIPSYSAVSGHALGGGLELALCTMFRVFATHVNVGLPETSLGIVPGAGGTYRLTRLVGRSHALSMMIAGNNYDLERYLNIGLCNMVVPFKPGLHETALQGRQGREYEKAAQHANHPRTVRATLARAAQGLASAPLAVRAVIQAVNGCSPEAEDEAYKSIINTEDRKEALQAFREKRKPNFKGR